MNVVDRAKNLLLQPKAEWAVIAAEPHTVQELYTTYVMVVAAVPAIASFIGWSLVGVGVLGTTYRVPVTAGIAYMVLSYVLNLAWVYILALIIDALAPNFAGEKNFGQAIRLAAFAPTAAWLAGVFAIIPMLSILSLVGLYSLYLLFVGLPMLMKAPEDKAVPYVVVVIIVAIVLTVVASALAGLVIPGNVRGF